MDRNEPKIAVAVLVVVLVVIGALVLGGGQTSAILSKVGAAIPYSGGQPATRDEAQPEPAATSRPALAADVQPLTLLIIRKGSLSLEAADIGPTVASAAVVVTASGGFVAGSTETGSGADEAATVDYRIPAASWDATLARLRGLATVRGQEISTEEVTGQVVDLGARIGNLRASEAALQAIMARASRIQDVLDVQKQLTETRGQIEELSAAKAGLEDRAAFGSLTVTFRLPPGPVPTATPRPGWNPAADVDQATAKLVRIGQKATTAGIWFAIVGLPILVALGIVLGLAWLIYHVVSRRRAAEEAATVG